MLASRLLAPTLREIPSEAELISHKLMLRAGMIRKVASGIYDYLPLGLKVVNKIAAIIREEMNNAGAQEILMPAVIPAELWQESGRWNFYGKELLRLKDRKEMDFCIGPTHEEVVTEIVRGTINSYKQLPINLYQIQNKFRDEIRPRFGLMRAREFMMKDAYSFHANDQCLNSEYQNMHETYCRIFERCGLDYRVVNASSGNIGGSSSQEFMVIADSGEDSLLFCDSCGYSANIETATFLRNNSSHQEMPLPMQEVATPDKKSIEEVASFLNVPANRMIKSLVYYYGKDEQQYLVMVLCSGEREINEEKLKGYLQADWLQLPEDEQLLKEEGLAVGFLGPIGLENNKIKIIADLGVKDMVNGITGANKKDVHLKNIQPGKDFEPADYADLVFAREGDNCSSCQTAMKLTRGIEVGHIFKLDTKYSRAMSANFLDGEGKQQPFIMGCYGIGVGRTAAAAIEQNNDERGIIWPTAIAPFQVVIIIASIQDDTQVKEAFELYYSLRAAGIDTLIDDRTERMGVKLNDADLIGYPLRIISGKKAAEKIFEVKPRKESTAQELCFEDTIAYAQEFTKI